MLERSKARTRAAGSTLHVRVQRVEVTCVLASLAAAGAGSRRWHRGCRLPRLPAQAQGRSARECMLVVIYLFFFLG